MKVQHDLKNHRFFIDLGSDQAYLSYARRDKTLDFFYVYTPNQHRNRGVAGIILKAAFDYAREKGFRVVPSCSYVRNAFLPRFAKYQDLVEPSFS